RLSRRIGPPTLPIRVTVTGAAPGAPVAVTFGDSPLVSGTAGVDGTFRGTGHVPRSAQPGAYWVTATSGTSRVRRDFLVRSDWHQYGAEADHRGVNRYENVLNAGNVGGLRELRLAPFVDHPPIWPQIQPAIGEGIAFVGDGNGRFWAIDATTGAVVW